MVIIEMENGGKIELELYPEAAPKTVANFLKLVNQARKNRTYGLSDQYEAILK